MDIALFILRVIVGLLVAGHGSQKLFGWFGGPGLAGFTGSVDSVGLRPARLWAVLGSLAEFGGGTLLALGLFSPLGSLGIAASMLMAIAKAHWPRIWSTDRGLEFPLTNLTVAIAVGIAGPGALSFDAYFGTALSSGVGAAGALIVVIGWIIGLVISSARPMPQQAPGTRK